ncbi:MAG: N-acetylmuramoyl-L-alanine amidase family protein [Alitiscatomonas sp.]
MKRLHGAAMLAAAAMFTASMGITGMADTSGAGENGSRLDGMVCMDGSVISAEDGRLHLNRRVEGGMTEVVVNLSEDTKILDAVNGLVSVENLDEGEAVRVYTGPAMTLSLPPITNGLLVLADAPADSGFPVYAVVESLTQEPDKADGTEAAYILETAGGMKYTVSDSTALLPYLTRNMVFATDLKKGTPILLWTDGTDGSAAEKIVIFQGEGQDAGKENADGLGFHGWKEEAGSWYYYEQGQKKTGWLCEGTDWYYLDPESGRMATGFVTVDGKTYFLKDDGRMLTEAAEFVPDANGALSLKK